MPSFRRRASVIDADHVEEPSKQPEDAAQALALAEEAEAEAAEAEAVAAAARAKARAIRLRREAEAAGVKETTDTQADSADTDTETVTGTETVTDTDIEGQDVGTGAEDEADVGTDAEDEADAAAEEPQGKPARRSLLRRIKWKYVAASLVILCTGALVAASGYMVWQHRLAQQRQQETAEYAAAARQGVVTLMSLDFNRAKDDVQRIIDNTTGEFKEDFEASAEDFAKIAQDSKVVTEGTVNVVAVKEMTDHTAQALVSATSRVTNTAGANREPRPWRLLVDLVREGDQIKMSKVEFVL